jgi:Secretion system C-terminal sorting domain
VKNTLVLSLFLLLCHCFNAQNVSIPDINFKNYLLSNVLINVNLDSEIQITEAANYTGSIFAENKNISDLTGIEAFVNLTTLHCFTNQLTSLNLASNVKLTSLACGGNLLTSLNLSSNTLLQDLDAVLNQLSTITLGNNPTLGSLKLTNNQLSSLNVSSCSSLWFLNIKQNLITSIDLTNNPLLQTLIIENNPISSLDLSPLSALTIVQLKNNNLNFLNIQTGNNTGIFAFEAIGNPNLTCIQVDDSAWSSSNWASIDATSFFSENCSLGIAEEKTPVSVNVYPNPANNILNIHLINNPSEKKYLRIMTVTGDVVYKKHLNDNLNKVSISNLPTGYYSLIINNDEGVVVASKKLVIVH